MRTLGQFREFTKDLPDDFEIRIESYFEPGTSKTAPTFDYISTTKDRAVILLPETVFISDGKDQLAVTHAKEAKKDKGN